MQPVYAGRYRRADPLDLARTTVSRKARTSEAIASRPTEIRTTPPGRS
jgi:hypothetical protein